MKRIHTFNMNAHARTCTDMYARAYPYTCKTFEKKTKNVSVLGLKRNYFVNFYQHIYQISLYKVLGTWVLGFNKTSIKFNFITINQRLNQ